MTHQLSTAEFSFRPPPARPNTHAANLRLVCAQEAVAIMGLYALLSASTRADTLPGSARVGNLQNASFALKSLALFVNKGENIRGTANIAQCYIAITTLQSFQCSSLELSSRSV